MHFRDGRAATVGVQRVQERSSRSRVRITLIAVFFLLFPLIIIIFIFFFPFSLFLFLSSFLFQATLLIVNYILNPVVFSVAQKSPEKTLSSKKRWFVFFNRCMSFFLTSLHPFTFLMYYPFQARHPSIGNAS